MITIEYKCLEITIYKSIHFPKTILEKPTSYNPPDIFSTVSHSLPPRKAGPSEFPSAALQHAPAAQPRGAKSPQRFPRRWSHWWMPWGWQQILKIGDETLKLKVFIDKLIVCRELQGATKNTNKNVYFPLTFHQQWLPSLQDPGKARVPKRGTSSKGPEGSGPQCMVLFVSHPRCCQGNSKGSKPTQFAKALSKDSRKWFPALSGRTRVVQRYTAQMHQEMILQSRKSEMPAQVKPHFKFTKDAQQCLIHLGSKWPGSQTETQTLHLLFVFSWLDEDCPQGWKPRQQGSITSASIIHHTLQDCGRHFGMSYQEIPLSSP